ncbi:MAG: TerB family tellurite resistance protein [Alphaproteobacteria bacterium]
MIGRLKQFFERLDSSDAPSSPAGDEGIRLSAAFLLVEAACQDGDFDDAERETIARLLSDRFQLDSETCAELLAEAEEAQANAVQWQRHTRAIVDHFDAAQRIAMIEMLWEVVYADGQVDDYEANLLRRVGGLIYVSDRDRGEARKRVVARLGLR